MKKGWNVFRVQTEKIMGNLSFVLLILTVTAMCFLIPVMLDDGRTMIHCLSALFGMSREEFRMQESLRVASVISQLTGGYFVMFTPMLVSLGLLPVLCGERESGVYRLVLVRSGKKAGVAGTFLACVFCGGILMASGYLLFAVIWGIHSAVLSGIPEIRSVMKTSVFVLEKTAGVFTFGMMSAMWTYLVSVFVKNRYLLVGIPYIALWFLQRIAANIQWESMEKWFGLRLYGRTFGATYVFVDLKDTFQILAIYSVIGLFIVLLHGAVMKRRTDCGM